MTMTTTLTPIVDDTACAGHGDCLDIAPDVFALDDDLATVIGVGPDDLVLRAARACPSVAIVVVDQAGNQVYP